MTQREKSSAWSVAAVSAATGLLAACGGGGGADASTGTLRQGYFFLPYLPDSASYSPTLAPLSWLPYNASAARFSVRSTAPGSLPQSRTVDLSLGSARVDFSY